ncbi:5-bromo-4-chloroindolyl phosphate hydrolysis family protein [Bacillus sp. DJP31]|uniref:5-bromo-4-chloroindolyl phosphate hydrolysis family protein n=1 Tax=Bacillus sp. DJP31 TaxID=3409789 RepID=UPI003BB5426F
MNSFLTFLIRSLVAIPVTVISWFICMFSFDQTYFVSSGLSIGVGILTFGILGAYMKYRFVTRQGLSLKEYRYIRKNINEAKRKLRRLQKVLFQVRLLPSLKQRFDLLRLSSKIISLTKAEPKRFYKAERFYFTHIDSAVELTEKYVFLSSQPKKTVEVQSALDDTKKTIDELVLSIEQDLYLVLATDIDQLHFELDVAKHSIKNSKIIKEGRKIK